MAAIALLSFSALATAPLTLHSHRLLLMGRRLSEGTALVERRRELLELLGGCLDAAAGIDSASVARVNWRLSGSGGVRRLDAAILDSKGASTTPPDSLITLVLCTS